LMEVRTLLKPCKSVVLQHVQIYFTANKHRPAISMLSHTTHSQLDYLLHILYVCLGFDCYDNVFGLASICNCAEKFLIVCELPENVATFWGIWIWSISHRFQIPVHYFTHYSNTRLQQLASPIRQFIFYLTRLVLILFRCNSGEDGGSQKDFRFMFERHAIMSVHRR
jgi:hypothetical protein